VVGAQLCRDASRFQVNELGIGGPIEEFDRLREHQQRRRCKTVSATVMTAQMVQPLLSWVAATGLGAGWIAGAACAAVPSKFPNDSANRTASATSAGRAPSPKFDRNRFMQIHAR
jgi:hypothetical protein